MSILKEPKNGMPVAELCPAHGISKEGDLANNF